MVILTKYISREFFKIFIIAVLAVVVIYLVGDFFENTSIFTRYDASWIQAVSFFLYKIPMIIFSFATPIAVLIANILSIGLLSKHSEIIAMRANGISVVRLVVPLILIAFLLCLTTFLSNETIIPFTNRKVNWIERVQIKKNPSHVFIKQDKIWYHGSEAIYNIKFFDLANERLQGITLLYFDPSFHLHRRVDAQEVRWENKQWVFINGVERVFSPKGVEKAVPFESRIFQLPETPEDFKLVEKNTEEMNYGELRSYIKKIRKEGYDATRYRVDLYGKVAFPFASLIMALIGIPFGLRTSRYGGTAAGVGISIVIGIVYFIMLQSCLSLGHAGSVFFPPLVSAWTANFLFGMIGLYLLLTSPQ